MSDAAMRQGITAALDGASSTAMVYVHDRDSEGVIRQCLSDLAVVKTEFKNGGIDNAIADLASRPSPRLLIVDVTKVEDPVARVHNLANVCDPSTGVIIIGETNDIRLYRELKAAGVVEYHVKPLVRAVFMQGCNVIMQGGEALPTSSRNQIIFVVGTRPGSGATTIAVATAWHLAEVEKRRVTLLDLDLQFGDAALQLDVTPSHVLIDALEHPERIDELFLDRGMAAAAERLGVMAALEPLDEILLPKEDALLTLLERLLQRSRYVFVDVPSASVAGLTRVLYLPSTILLVSSASLVCARDVPRLRERLGPNSAERTTVHILNKTGTAESLPDEEFARAAGAPADIVIPAAREIAAASRLGIQGLQKCAALQRGLAPVFRLLIGTEPSVVRQTWLRGLFR